jgi:hypothetical protein
MLKTCTKCNTAQEISQYPKHSGYKDGHSTWCRKCLRVQADSWRLNNIERYNAVCRKRSPRYYRRKANDKFKDRYGITIEQYEQMSIDQNDRCAICNKHKDDNLKSKLFVDHDHVSSIIRGLLCSDCNTGLGRFHDSIGLLTKTINYLKLAQDKILKINNGDM